LAQPDAALSVEIEFLERLGFQVRGDVARNFQSVQRRVCSLLLRLILASRFSQRRGRFFDVENIVHYLKRPADVLAKTKQPRHVSAIRTASDGAGHDRSANQRS